jgi:hypothetical protein
MYFFHRPTLEAGDRRGKGWGADIFTEGFRAFWAAYPERLRSRKLRAKRKAWAEWKAVNPDARLERLILEKVTQYAEHWRTFGEGNGRYLLTPANWLREQRWEDEFPRQRNEHEEDELERADIDGGCSQDGPYRCSQDGPYRVPTGDTLTSTRNPHRGNLQTMVLATANSVGLTSLSEVEAVGEGLSPQVVPSPNPEFPGQAPRSPSSAPAPSTPAKCLACPEQPTPGKAFCASCATFIFVTCRDCGKRDSEVGEIRCAECAGHGAEHVEQEHGA